MTDEVRLIDAGKLIGYLHEKTFIDGDDRSMVYKAIEEQPTIEAVTREDFIQAAKQLIAEFGGGGVNTEENHMIMALVFGNLELRLFGSRDGDSK